MHVEFDYGLRGYGAVQVEADVDLGRPAPPCSDPNSPRYADDGDPPECEITSCITPEGTEIEDRLSVRELEILWTRAIEVAADQARDAKGF